jgi:hypothetical protein
MNDSPENRLHLAQLQDDYDAWCASTGRVTEGEVVRFTIAREDLQGAIEDVLRPYVYADAVERAAREIMEVIA